MERAPAQVPLWGEQQSCALVGRGVKRRGSRQACHSAVGSGVCLGVSSPAAPLKTAIGKEPEQWLPPERGLTKRCPRSQWLTPPPQPPP